KTKFTISLIAIVLGFSSCNTEDITDQNANQAALSTKQEVNASTSKVGVCSEVPGWASQNGGTTGGGTAAETVVTTYAQLKSAIENTSMKVIKVSGTITVSARLSFQNQTGKTIYGASGARIVSTNQTKDG